MTRRLLIVHSAGDFREAWRLREQSGGEVYYGHSYILDELARMAATFDEAGYLAGSAPVYDERLPSGARVLGAGADPYADPAPTLAAMARFAPTHLIVHGPIAPLLRWGLQNQLEVGCVLADSFHIDPVRRWLRHRGLPRLLNDPGITLVGNHGVNAARGLVDLGVRPDKVIAWDFPHARSPADFAPRQLGPAGPRRLFYAGLIVRSKGVGELIRAVARLKPTRDVRVSIAGAGRVDAYRNLARRLGVADRVEFLGLVPNTQVLEHMRQADAVVVPSRHAFPEGLPLTLYEALTSRTPLIASDHPMFRGHLRDGESALVFPAGNARALAAAIERLFDDAALYERLSRHAADAWQRMQCPVKWGTMIERWTRGDPSDLAWLRSHALDAGEPQ
ncbi:glycosyltransferase family 4 protein [Novosphingobium soli]|uniref:Glycosyltransferase family 4 protein n=1 Tax=Novosphingobium soli TaxID=574956 RepID=A0ABV6CWI1_9SPHN